MTKSVWVAVALPRSEIAYTLRIDLPKRQSWVNWIKHRGLKLLGEFTTQQQTRQRINQWLSLKFHSMEN